MDAGKNQLLTSSSSDFSPLYLVYRSRNPDLLRAILSRHDLELNRTIGEAGDLTVFELAVKEAAASDDFPLVKPFIEVASDKLDVDR